MAPPTTDVSSLFVADLRPEVDEAQLRHIFKRFGPLANIHVCRDSLFGVSRGYAYVNFESAEGAERALQQLNYTRIHGRACRIQRCQKDPAGRNGGVGNLVVSNLDKSFDNKALFDYFSQIGEVVSCKVAADDYGNSYGYGFVQFESDELAEVAVSKLNGALLGDQVVKVLKWKKKMKTEQEPLAAGQGKRAYTNLYFKCFPPDWTEEHCRGEFQRFGTILGLSLHKDKKDRPYGFVNFDEHEAAQKAICALHLREVGDAEVLAKDERDGEGHPLGKLFVGPWLPRAERRSQLRSTHVGGDGLDAGTGTGAAGDAQAGDTSNLVPGCVFVKSLPASFTEESLRALFGACGQVISTSMPRDAAGKGKGYAFVAYGSPAEAQSAVAEMHLREVEDSQLHVALAEKRDRYGQGGARQPANSSTYDSSRGYYLKGGGKGKMMFWPPGKGKGGKGGKGFEGMVGFGGPAWNGNTKGKMMFKGGMMMSLEDQMQAAFPLGGYMYPPMALPGVPLMYTNGVPLGRGAADGSLGPLADGSAYAPLIPTPFPTIPLNEKGGLHPPGHHAANVQALMQQSQQQMPRLTQPLPLQLAQQYQAVPQSAPQQLQQHMLMQQYQMTLGGGGEAC